MRPDELTEARALREALERIRDMGGYTGDHSVRMKEEARRALAFDAAGSLANGLTDTHNAASSVSPIEVRVPQEGKDDLVFHVREGTLTLDTRLVWDDGKPRTVRTLALASDDWELASTVQFTEEEFREAVGFVAATDRLSVGMSVETPDRDPADAPNEGI